MPIEGGSANREVLVAGGVITSPQLLQLSGIGEKGADLVRGRSLPSG